MRFGVDAIPPTGIYLRIFREKLFWTYLIKSIKM